MTEGTKERRRLVSLRPWQRQWTWWMVYLSIGSGLALFILKYFVEADPFSVSGKLGEPWFKAIHLFTSPILIFLVGSMMLLHVIPNFRERKHFWSGNIMLATFAIYSITGMFLFFVALPEEWLDILKWIHTITGFVFYPVMVYHWWTRYNVKPGRSRTQGA